MGRQFLAFRGEYGETDIVDVTDGGSAARSGPSGSCRGAQPLRSQMSGLHNDDADLNCRVAQS